MKLDFYKDEWDGIINNCDFTDIEIKIIELLRRGWCLIDIAEELYISLSTVKRRKKSIENKIIHYIVLHK